MQRNSTLLLYHFNPRSREGSDTNPQNKAQTQAISIHAPAKGATLLWLALALAAAISIHAPAKGATISSLFAVRSAIFQSTLPRRERPISSALQTSAATFQSTLPRRERQGVLLGALQCRSFQSTLPRRERRRYRGRPCARANFNPRSREGSDFAMYSSPRIRPAISIHAPAKGATCIR